MHWVVSPHQSYSTEKFSLSSPFLPKLSLLHLSPTHDKCENTGSSIVSCYLQSYRDLESCGSMAHASLWEVRAISHTGQEPRCRNDTVRLTGSLIHGLLSLFSYIMKHLPNYGITHSELDSPPSIINQENALQTWLQANLMDVFSLLSLLLSI